MLSRYALFDHSAVDDDGAPYKGILSSPGDTGVDLNVNAFNKLNRGFLAGKGRAADWANQGFDGSRLRPNVAPATGYNNELFAMQREAVQTVVPWEKTGVFDPLGRPSNVASRLTDVRGNTRSLIAPLVSSERPDTLLEPNPTPLTSQTVSGAPMGHAPEVSWLGDRFHRVSDIQRSIKHAHRAGNKHE